MKVAIIGAGASGLALASFLNDDKSIEVTIFEKNHSAGRKILASGNGRCNLSNLDLDDKFYHNANYFSYDKYAFLDFLADNNCLILPDDEGRIYPESNTAKTILNLLLDKCNNCHFIYDEMITKIDYINNKYIISGLEFDYLVLACGSVANYNLDKAKSFYSLFQNLNLKMTELKPSLVGFKIKENYKFLSGERFKVVASLYVNDELIHKENGEVIFKDDGISGIVIMNMSFYYNQLVNKKDAYLLLDLYPNLDYATLLELNKSKTGLKYAINPKLLNMKDLINNLKKMKLNIISTYDSSKAQVISGGISLSKMNKDFSYKDYKNLYICGELLDVDGACGGYNLNFAFNSGIAIAKKIRGIK